MKRGYKKLLIFEIITMVLLFLNSFVSSILSGYVVKLLFLIIILIFFKFLFGFEKDRHHLAKSVCVEILIFLLLYFILYYLLGIVISFVKTTNYYTFQGLFKVILPIIITIILKEIFRYMCLRKSEGSRLLIIISCILFIIIDIVGIISFKTFESSYTIFMFLAIYFLPIISKNILCTYISYNVGYKPAIVYLLITELYRYLLPIIPNPSEYLFAVTSFVVPFILLYRIYLLLKKEKDEYIIREYHKKRIGGLILPLIIVIILVYFTSGYFHYHAIVVASGSMTPNIYKGDVVVIEKIENDFDLLKLNQVIAYKYNDVIIVHRLVKKIMVDGEYYYYTKGDANNDIDGYKITKDMIIGIVDTKIPYIGYPTIWFKKL